MPLFDKEFNEYREKNESFEKTWMASSVNDVAKWALICGVLILLQQFVSLTKTLYYISQWKLDFILNWKSELIGFVLIILSIIGRFILLSFAVKYKKAFKKGDETACIRLIGLLKSFFVWESALVLFGFCVQEILLFFTK
jgi:hypothetical protein